MLPPLPFSPDPFLCKASSHASELLIMLRERGVLMGIEASISNQDTLCHTGCELISDDTVLAPWTSAPGDPGMSDTLLELHLDLCHDLTLCELLDVLYLVRHLHVVLHFTRDLVLQGGVLDADARLLAVSYRAGRSFDTSLGWLLSR